MELQSWVIIILLGLGVILYAKIVNNNDSQPIQKKLYEEMEDTFENFAMEIEEENKQLLQYIMSMKQQHEKENSILLSRIEQLEKQCLSISLAYQNNMVDKEESKELQLIYNKKKDKASDKTQVSEIIEMTKNLKEVEPNKKTSTTKQGSFANDMRNRYQDLFQLYNQGKSVEYIAKKLEMNKGEIQLIIQLAKQEDQFSV